MQFMQPNPLKRGALEVLRLLSVFRIALGTGCCRLERKERRVSRVALATMQLQNSDGVFECPGQALSVDRETRRQARSVQVSQRPRKDGHYIPRVDAKFSLTLDASP
jgi:hypothetical protein